MSKNYVKMALNGLVVRSPIHDGEVGSAIADCVAMMDNSAVYTGCSNPTIAAQLVVRILDNYNPPANLRVDFARDELYAAAQKLLDPAWTPPRRVGELS